MDMLKFSQEQQRLMMQAQVEHDRALAQAAAADQAAVERARSEGIPEPRTPVWAHVIC